MAAAAEKVVRLEEIEDDQRSTTSEELAALVATGPVEGSPIRTSTKSALGKPISDGRSESRQSDALVEYVPSEARDLLRPYPEGWPKLPAVVEARDYTTTQAPAVNLASAHLELLQNIIDDWFKSASPTTASRRVSNRDFQSQASSRRHLRFEVAPEAQSPDELTLVGVGGKADSEKQRSSHGVVEEVADDLPYLGAEQVVEEVINLLAKLENDRRDVHAEYKMERDKVKRLSARIDGLAERRLDMMPAAVQNEHEACARDIYELQWHISYRGRIRDRTVLKREQAEALNKKLQAEIAYLLEQSPLVREKLDLESAIMDKIHAAQKETSGELSRTVDKCDRLQRKSDDMHLKADQERDYMRDELVSLNKDFQKISAELERVRVQHEKFLEKIEKTRSDITQCEEDTAVMKTRNEEAHENQKATQGRVRGLKETIYSKEQHQKELVDEMIKKQKKIDARKKAQTTVESKLQKNVDQLEDEYQFVHRIAQEFDLDIEDFIRKIEECEKQRSDNEKRIEGIKRSLASTGEELQAITQDFHNVEALHNALSTNLAAEEAKAKKIEEQLRAALSGLKKQVNDEKNARAMLESNIASDKVELAKSEEEGQMKKGKLEKLSAELQKAVNEVLSKVEGLRTVRAEKDEELDKLRAELADTRAEHEQVQEELGKRKKALVPEEEQLKHLSEALEARDSSSELVSESSPRVPEIPRILETPSSSDSRWDSDPSEDDMPEHVSEATKVLAANLTLDKQLDHLEWRSEMMKKKMEDMAASSVMMTRATLTTETAIKQLSEHLEELSLRFEAHQKALAELQQLVNDTTIRNHEYEQAHQELMGERRKVLDQHVKDLDTNHANNTLLASQYRRLDNECMVMKDKLLNEIEEALQIENTLKDTRQMRSLQSKMHSALCEYLRHRGLYMQTELDCMEAEAYHNCNKVRTLHGDIKGTMDVTSEFLVSAMDHSQARRMAEAAVIRQEQQAHSQAHSQVRSQAHSQAQTAS